VGNSRSSSKVSALVYYYTGAGTAAIIPVTC